MGVVGTAVNHLRRLHTEFCNLWGYHDGAPPIGLCLERVHFAVAGEMAEDRERLRVEQDARCAECRAKTSEHDPD